MRCTRSKGAWLAVALLAAPLGAAGADAPLADAVQRQDLAAVGDLLQASTDVNARQVDGMTALHWAAYHDDAHLVERFVEAGADVHAENRYGVTALSLAAENANVEMVERLLAAGADPNTTLPGGETVLMTAARTGRVGAVRALLAAGADIGAGEVERGQTALMWAVAEGHVDVVEDRWSRWGRTSVRRSIPGSRLSCSPPARVTWVSCGRCSQPASTSTAPSTR